MKNQALFSSKDKSKKLKCRLLQFLFGALRVKYLFLYCRESHQTTEDGEEGRNVSVAERIFQMHSKIEEVRSCPITPKARSGLTTPKSAINR